MSILINSIKMPKNCFDCPCFNDEYCRCQTSGNWDKGAVYEAPPDWCPLVPVPPHGRLIDADALMREMHNVILEDGEDRRIFYSVIERQPTVIPAEEGK